MGKNIFSFEGWFKTGDPFSDTFRYLHLSEDMSIEDAMIQAIWIFYYPKLLKKMSASLERVSKVQGDCMAYCQKALADLDKLENQFRDQGVEQRRAKFKRRSPNSQNFFKAEIDCNWLEPEFAEALKIFRTGQIGNFRYLLCQATSAIYYPLAANAFADPFEKMIDAIGKSRRKFEWLLVEYNSNTEQKHLGIQSRSSILDENVVPSGELMTELQGVIAKNLPSKPPPKMEVDSVTELTLSRKRRTNNW
jgi:hypothetical protein